MNLQRRGDHELETGRGVSIGMIVVGVLALIGGLWLLRMLIYMAIPLIVIGGLGWLVLRLMAGGAPSRRVTSDVDSGDRAELERLRRRVDELERGPGSARGSARDGARGSARDNSPRRTREEAELDEFERRMRELDELETKLDDSIYRR